MANIASQEKRIHRAERERLENRRRTSQVKTWFHRLESAVDDGDGERADGEYRSLVSRIDKAVKSGALHRNNAARKKAAPRACASQLLRNHSLSPVETRLLIGGEQVPGDGDALAVESPPQRRRSSSSPSLPPSRWTRPSPPPTRRRPAGPPRPPWSEASSFGR